MQARKLIAALAAVPLTLVAGVGVAYADNVINNVTAGGTDTITAGGSTTIGYKVNATGGDDQDKCNADDGSPAVVTLSVPAAVTASKTTLTFNTCGDFQNVTFSSSTPGNYAITASVSDPGAGTYKNEANFTLRVNPGAPTNAKPTVKVTGVTDGATYEIGTPLSPMCEVTDAEDGASSFGAAVAGGLTHGLGELTATCDHTDSGGMAADTASATYFIVDTTDPAIEYALSSSSTPSNGWYKDDVTVTFSCADPGGSGIESCGPSKTLGEGENQSVTGTATDWAGNTATATVSGINIDKTAPTTPTFTGFSGGPFYYGSAPAAPGCDSSDALSGLDSCDITGGGASIGKHTYTATATDKAGNTSTSTLEYEVLAWTLKGFYAPVDMSNGLEDRVLNTVKGGSTVPLKFEVFAGEELTSVPAIGATFKVMQVGCPSGAQTDAVEVLGSGGTALRYDSTSGQFIQNWQTPKKPGTCYTASVTTADGSVVKADFQLK